MDGEGAERQGEGRVRWSERKGERAGWAGGRKG